MQFHPDFSRVLVQAFRRIRARVLFWTSGNRSAAIRRFREIGLHGATAGW